MMIDVNCYFYKWLAIVTLGNFTTLYTHILYPHKVTQIGKVIYICISMQMSLSKLFKKLRQIKKVWQGFQHLTNFGGSSCSAGNSSASLAEELNCFFACFDTPKKSTSPQPAPGSGTAPTHIPGVWSNADAQKSEHTESCRPWWHSREGA